MWLEPRAEWVPVVTFLQAGAKHVYAIECSAIADQAKQIVRDNGFEGRVTIIQGKVRKRMITAVLAG